MWWVGVETRKGTEGKMKKAEERLKQGRLDRYECDYVGREGGWRRDKIVMKVVR